MLLYTLPKVADRLQSDDLASREAAATLLARLVAATSFDYAAEYPAVFCEWLRRFVDKEPTVRLKMVQLGLKCLEAGPTKQTALAILDKCATRREEPAWDGRRGAVHACADAVYALAPRGLGEREGGAAAAGAGVRAAVPASRSVSGVCTVWVGSKRSGVLTMRPGSLLH